MTFKFKKSRLAFFMFIENLINVTTVFLILLLAFILLLGDFSLIICRVVSFILAYLVFIRLLYKPMSILRSYSQKYIFYEISEDKIIIQFNKDQKKSHEQYEIFLNHVISKHKNKRFYILNLNREKSNGIKKIRIPIVNNPQEFDNWFERIKTESSMNGENHELQVAIESTSLANNENLNERGNEEIIEKVIFQSNNRLLVKYLMASRYTSYIFQGIFLLLASICLIMISTENYLMAMVVFIAIILQFLAPYINIFFLKKSMSKQQSIYIINETLTYVNGQMGFSAPIDEMVYSFKENVLTLEHQGSKKKVILIDKSLIQEGNSHYITDYLDEVNPSIHRTVISTMSLWLSMILFLMMPGILIWEKFFEASHAIITMGILFICSIILDMIQKIYYKKIVKETLSSLVIKVISVFIILMMIITI